MWNDILDQIKSSSYKEVLSQIIDYLIVEGYDSPTNFYRLPSNTYGNYEWCFEWIFNDEVETIKRITWQEEGYWLEEMITKNNEKASFKEWKFR